MPSEDQADFEEQEEPQTSLRIFSKEWNKCIQKGNQDRMIQALVTGRVEREQKLQVAS
ncbi:2858_t:CDS:2 [Ambispora gerdemannii]|uniref:2858_t:CDS:1 n=1 Tax=Ambispora gerdemannii TaxID=144530 RepID=A0A9N9F8X8_9GLOM|nr:2858_t:CDS:2 [Ambispora gerdemannii]